MIFMGEQEPENCWQGVPFFATHPRMKSVAFLVASVITARVAVSPSLNGAVTEVCSKPGPQVYERLIILESISTCWLCAKKGRLTCRRVVLPKGHGRTYMLGVGKQYNTIVVSARGQHLEVLPDFERHLQKAASNVSHTAKMRFKVERRATLDFREL